MNVSRQGLGGALVFVIGAFVFVGGLLMGRLPHALLGALLLLVSFLSVRAARSR